MGVAVALEEINARFEGEFANRAQTYAPVLGRCGTCGDCGMENVFDAERFG